MEFQGMQELEKDEERNKSAGATAGAANQLHAGLSMQARRSGGAA